MTAVAPVEKIKPALTDGHRDRQESTHSGHSHRRPKRSDIGLERPFAGERAMTRVDPTRTSGTIPAETFAHIAYAAKYLRTLAKSRRELSGLLKAASQPAARAFSSSPLINPMPIRNALRRKRRCITPWRAR